MKNLWVKWKNFLHRVVFCQIFRRNLYPEIPGGYPESEPELTWKYRNRIGTGIPRTGTGPEPPIWYPVQAYKNVIPINFKNCLTDFYLFYRKYFLNINLEKYRRMILPGRRRHDSQSIGRSFFLEARSFHNLLSK